MGCGATKDSAVQTAHANQEMHVDETLTRADSNKTSAVSKLSEFEGPIRSEDETRGERVFNEHCAECHHDEGPGYDLSGRSSSPARVRFTVRHGIPQWNRMPPFDQNEITDSDLEALLAFLENQVGMFSH